MSAKHTLPATQNEGGGGGGTAFNFVHKSSLRDASAAYSQCRCVVYVVK